MRKRCLLILTLLIVLCASECRKQRIYDRLHSATDVIGTDGGTITTSSGASIMIPSGALTSSTEITITSYEKQEDMPESAGTMGTFAGGIVLEPDGLIFQEPVTLTIPLNTYLYSTDEVVLFYYDKGDPSNSNYPDGYSGWQQTDFIGTVSDDGRSVTVEVDHFSAYVIQLNFGASTVDVLGDMVETLGDNGLSVDFNNYQSYFESVVAKLGDMHVYDLPGGFGYDCYKVVGIEYILYHDLGVLFENPLYNFKGVEGEIALCYNYEGDRFLPGGQQMIYQLFINVYIDRAPPDLSLMTWTTLLQTGDETDVLGCIRCGLEPMMDQDVQFESNNLGSVSPDEETTDLIGMATVTFKAGNREGQAVVTAEYEARDKDRTELISDNVSITITEEDIDEEDLPCAGCRPFVVDFPVVTDPCCFDPPPQYFLGCGFTLEIARSNPDWSIANIYYISCEEYCAHYPDNSICPDE